jgi:GxxExxY protein
MEDYKYKEITSKIIATAFEVHKVLGGGLQEIIYQRAFAIELQKINIKLESEKSHEIFYKDQRLPIGKRRLDFLIENLIVVELKSCNQIEDRHIAQVLSYLKIFNLEIGLILNFGGKSLTIKRIIHCP